MINIFIKIFNKTHVLVFETDSKITIYELFIKGIKKYLLTTNYKNFDEFIKYQKNINFLNGCYLIFNSKYYNLNEQKKFNLIDLKDLTLYIEFSSFKNNNLKFNSQ
tara:strand:- start:119 stop:436 length:318 start_codon:yes stop_codon:yes gene_type:complete